MPQLAGEQHDLSAVMAFMRDEIGQNVADVQGEVAPHVRRGVRNTAAGVAPEPEKAVDAPTAAFERRHQLLSADPPAIDAVRYRNAMLLADHLDPHAPRVVDMSREHADSATWSPWNFRSPYRCGQVLDEKNRDSVVGFPRRQDCVSKVRRGRHDHLSRLWDLDVAARSFGTTRQPAPDNQDDVEGQECQTDRQARKAGAGIGPVQAVGHA